MMGLNVLLTIWAILAAVVGALLLWWRASSAKEARLMATTPTSPAADVGKLAPGTLVEVKGMLRCAVPLTAEFSQQACAYFKAEITREEVWHESGSDGKRRSRTRSTTLHSNVQYAPCVIEDASGTVAVNMTDATIEGVKVFDQIAEPSNTLAGVMGAVASLAGTSAKDRHTETLLPADIPVYLLGEVRSDGTIGAPAKGSANKTFLISNKTEEERSQDLASSMTWLGWIAAASLVAAAGLLIAAWVKGPT